MLELKEKFYVFLDFDGVLYDLKDMAKNTKSTVMSYVKRKHEKNGKSWPFSQDSMDALTYLMESLSTKYSPELVISSTWRRIQPLDVKMLKSQGFDVSKYPISRTSGEGNPLKRGLAVKQYLEKTPFPNNYVILDDQTYDFAEHFPEERWIHTNIVKDRLTLDKVEKFLDSIECPHENGQDISYSA